MIKAVIFDMDGVIADTEPLHEKARNALLKELRLNVEKNFAHGDRQEQARLLGGSRFPIFPSLYGRRTHRA